MAPRQYFGTDGIRGQANQPPMTVDLIQALGSAIVDWLHSESPGGESPAVVVGRDTRRSGPVLEAAFSAGVCAAGGEVLQVGVVPTPAVAWLTQERQAALGVVLSASHNPYQDNGIKLFGPDGYKLTDAQELQIEAALEARLGGQMSYPSAEDIGELKHDAGAAERYLSHLQQLWPEELSLSGEVLVIDGAHGAAFALGPKLFRELGATVHSLGDAPNGLNINEGVGALHPQGLKPKVLESGARMGLAFDGDADRLIVVDEKGEIVDGDKIMAICATHLHKEGRLPHATLVATVMSNLGMERTLADRGIRLERTKVGDRYVLERMRQGGFVLGGEQSGHLIFSDTGTTGDGIAAALHLLKVVITEDLPLSELAAGIQRFPQLLKNVKVREKHPWQEIPRLKQSIEAAQQKLGDKGRVFVRYSGTENKARVMVEGADAEQIAEIATTIAGIFEQELGL